MGNWLYGSCFGARSKLEAWLSGLLVCRHDLSPEAKWDLLREEEYRQRDLRTEPWGLKRNQWDWAAENNRNLFTPSPGAEILAEGICRVGFFCGHEGESAPGLSCSLWSSADNLVSQMYPGLPRKCSILAHEAFSVSLHVVLSLCVCLCV